MNRFEILKLPPKYKPIYELIPEPEPLKFEIDPEIITTGRRVIIPLFEIASNTQIPRTQILELRYNLIERAQELARTEIAENPWF